MAVAGIIAEFNLFHRGHALLFAETRARLGAETPIVVCMSGNFVQRGDFAVLDKHRRTEAVLRGGADLVLELPTAWACAGAERFAQGGVAVLAATGVVTHLVFGCECGVLEPLRRIAEYLDGSMKSIEGVHRMLKKGMPYAAARQEAVREALGPETAACLSLPNNTLAVEYLRAIKLLKADMDPVAIPRVGAAHDSITLDTISSAGAIRRLLLSGEDWRPYVPPVTAEVLDRAIAAGAAPVDMRNCERAVLAQLRRMREADFAPYDGGGEGLYHRFYAAVRSSASLEELLKQVKTRRYPMARLRRMLLHSYLGFPEAAPAEMPPYVRVLGVGPRGLRLLRRKAATLPIVTKPAHTKRYGGAVQACFAREAACTDLYSLAAPVPAKPGDEYRKGPVLLTGHEKEEKEKKEDT